MGSILGSVFILVGFIAIANYRASQNLVQQESAAIMKMDYNIKSLSPSANTTFLSDYLIKYTTNVVDLEWPAMSQGLRDTSNDPILSSMANALLDASTKLNVTNTNQQTIIRDTYLNLEELSQLRQKRYGATKFNIIPSYVWAYFTIIILAIFILIMFLVIRHRLQIIMVVLLTVATSTGLSIIINIDAPFIGEVSILPTEYMVNLIHKAEPFNSIQQYSLTPDLSH
jgi:hypothetical protein